MKKPKKRGRKKFSNKFRLKLYNKQNGLCAYCKNPMRLSVEENPNLIDLDMIFTIDHIVPLSKKGTNDESNIIGACYKCNQKKGSKIVKTFKPTEELQIKKLKNFTYFVDQSEIKNRKKLKNFVISFSTHEYL